MNRQQRVAYNARKTKITVYKLTVLAIACILMASVRYYFEGYRSDTLSLWICFVFGGLGWIILFIRFNWILLTEKKISFKRNKSDWLKQITIKTTTITVSILISAGYLISLDHFATKRTNHILNNEPTQNTTALVDRIEHRNSRNGGYDVAIITYNANGLIFEKAIGEHLGDYQVGQKLQLIYSIKYPEMFSVYK